MTTQSKVSQKNLHKYQQDMLKSGLNWQVEKRPLFDEKGKKLRIEGTFRSDNNYFLGAVTPGYTVVQNEELFRFPEELVKAGEKIEFSGAGSYQGGEGVFVKYKLPHKIDVKHVGDIIETELVVQTKHNGKGSVINRVNSKRLVCTNGLMTSDKGFLTYVRHSSSAKARLAIARNTIVHIGQEVKKFGELANALVDVKLSQKDIQDVVEKFYYKDDTSNIYTSSIKQNQARAILSIFEANDNDRFKRIRGTAWNLLNAFTNFADHRMNYRTSREETEAQAVERGKLFGAGQVLKFRALQIIATVLHKNHSINFPQEYIIG